MTRLRRCGRRESHLLNCSIYHSFLQGIPSDKKRYSVAYHGWIGKALGYPRGARMIGWIMNESPNGVPAQRVINSKGELSGSWAFGQSGTMRQLQKSERESPGHLCQE
jgi:alkylated DNA nucleotide flippase Atl1